MADDDDRREQVPEEWTDGPRGDWSRAGGMVRFHPNHPDYATSDDALYEAWFGNQEEAELAERELDAPFGTYLVVPAADDHPANYLLVGEDVEVQHDTLDAANDHLVELLSARYLNAGVDDLGAELERLDAELLGPEAGDLTGDLNWNDRDADHQARQAQDVARHRSEVVHDLEQSRSARSPFDVVGRVRDTIRLRSARTQAAAAAAAARDASDHCQTVRAARVKATHDYAHHPAVRLREKVLQEIDAWAAADQTVSCPVPLPDQAVDAEGRGVPGLGHPGAAVDGPDGPEVAPARPTSAERRPEHRQPRVGGGNAGPAMSR